MLTYARIFLGFSVYIEDIVRMHLRSDLCCMVGLRGRCGELRRPFDHRRNPRFSTAATGD